MKPSYIESIRLKDADYNNNALLSLLKINHNLGRKLLALIQVSTSTIPALDSASIITAVL
jgi:hypothetical protein